MSSEPPPPYATKEAKATISNHGDIEAALTPSMTPPSPAKLSTQKLHTHGAICTCCPIHQALASQTPYQPAPLPWQTTVSAEKKVSEEDEDGELATRFAAILLFLGLGIWLTHTGRVSHVSWRLGLGITMLVLGVLGFMAFLVDGPNGGKEPTEAKRDGDEERGKGAESV